MPLFDPTNLPAQPNVAFQSNSSYAQTILTATGHVSVEPGDWVVLNPSAALPDPIRKNLYQVSNVLSDGVTIQFLYSQDNGLTYQSTNLTGTWILYVFRMQPGS